MALRAILLAFMCLAGPAGAQDAGEFEFPNPLRLQNLAATCGQMTAQIRAADPRAMQAMAGIWQGTVMVPGAEGFYPPSQGQVQVTNDLNGTYVILTYACLQPLAGGEFCNTGQTYGEWAAHFTPDGWIAVPASSSGTGISGYPLPTSCGIGFWRQVDANTIESREGVRLFRVGE